MNPRNADRDQAIAAGRKKYLGRPCKHGHDGMRYVARSTCIECAFLRKEADRAKRGKPE